ncbi:MAG: triple tyrosine motif-containing protein [Bacteroidota bacterium]
MKLFSIRYSFLLHLVFMPFVNTFSQQLGLPFTKYISSSEYNAGMQNFSIAQDGRGFIYIANNFGLLEFDGKRWQLHTVRDGSKVRDVEIDQSGKIFIAAQGDFGYFQPNQNGFLTYKSLADSLSEEKRNFDEVWNVFVTNDIIYYCTFNTIFIFEGDVLKESIPINTSTEFYFVNNKLYYQEEDGSIGSLNNGDIQKAVFPKQLNESFVSSILPYKDSQILLVTSNAGSFLGELDKCSLSDRWFSELQDVTVSKVARLRNSDLVFGTQDNGLYIYSEDGRLKMHLNKGLGLQDRTVLSILEDRQGNLWLGHNNGITIVELSLPFTYINEELSLPGSGYDAYEYDGDIYLATNTGLFQGTISSASINLMEVENSDGQVYNINRVAEKVLLGHHNGSYEINGNRAEVISDKTGSWIFLQMDEHLICGTYAGLQLFENKGGSWKYSKDVYGFNESSRVMELDDNGDIWMSHGYKGVYRLKLNNSKDSVINVDYYGTEDGLPSQVLNNVYKIAGEILFTTINGIYFFNSDSNQFYKEEPYSSLVELNSPLNVLADDANQNIYFLGQEYLGVMEKDAGGGYEVNVDLFNKVRPLLNDDLANISVLNSNNILLGAKEGFVVYNPSVSSVADNEFNAFIRSVQITSNTDSTIFGGNFIDDGKVIDNQPEHFETILDYKHNSVRFEYSANFMNDADKTTYQYMLEGYERNWSQWQTLAEKEYTNLTEGIYTFHVKAKNINNTESHEATFRFEVLPPWYRSNIAYAGYSGLFAAIFISGFVLIDRKYRKSTRHLEITKQKEIDEIDSKLKTVTQETAEKIEQLTSEKLKSEIEVKNVELASSTMNLINKNEFIARIKGSLSMVQSKSTSAEVKKELTRIVKEIDKNISHDDDWHQFEFHFNKVHGDFTTRLTSKHAHLSAQDIRLCSYLRLNLSTKEIANLLNISVRGVEISRYRLRKKLNLERSDNLSEFILNF